MKLLCVFYLTWRHFSHIPLQVYPAGLVTFHSNNDITTLILSQNPLLHTNFHPLYNVHQHGFSHLNFRPCFGNVVRDHRHNRFSGDASTQLFPTSWRFDLLIPTSCPQGLKLSFYLSLSPTLTS